MTTFLWIHYDFNWLLIFTWLKENFKFKVQVLNSKVEGNLFHYLKNKTSQGSNPKFITIFKIQWNIVQNGIIYGKKVLTYIWLLVNCWPKSDPGPNLTLDLFLSKYSSFLFILHHFPSWSFIFIHMAMSPCMVWYLDLGHQTTIPTSTCNTSYSTCNLKTKEYHHHHGKQLNL